MLESVMPKRLYTVVRRASVVAVLDAADSPEFDHRKF